MRTAVITTSHRRRILLATLAGAAVPGGAFAQAVDPWLPVRRLVGDWSGTATGQAGEGAVTRRYSWIMGGRFLNEVNVSVYPPQEKNKSGERHEHWGIFSYDRARKAIVLRQFHVESFVNTYRHVAVPDKPDALMFESESFENFSNAWRARESYEFDGADEFVETFELAAPGKDYQLYSRTQLRRASR